MYQYLFLRFCYNRLNDLCDELLVLFHKLLVNLYEVVEFVVIGDDFEKDDVDDDDDGDGFDDTLNTRDVV